jgi:hypothetical protein
MSKASDESIAEQEEYAATEQSIDSPVVDQTDSQLEDQDNFTEYSQDPFVTSDSVSQDSDYYDPFLTEDDVVSDISFD